MKYILVEKDTYSIKDESEKEIEEKLNNGTIHISQVIDPTPRIQEVAVNKHPSDIRFIQNLDKSLLLKTIRIYPYVVQWLDDLEERFLLNAVRFNPMVIEFIKERYRTYNIRRVALKANPLCAQFLSNFTDEEISIIYDNEPEALRFVFNEANDWTLKAVKKKPSTIIIFEKFDIIGRPGEDDESTAHWEVALRKDPYLSYYLMEDDQLLMIDDIKEGILSRKYFQALTQLSPKVRELIEAQINSKQE